MTHFLQKVLPDDQPLLENGLKLLEKTTGHQGVDTRLIADIMSKAHSAMRLLHLDTRDTTGQELFNSLVSAVKNDDIEQLLQDCDYILYTIDNSIISFNLIDIIENYHHGLGYGNQSVTHGQRSLRGEILARYINHARANEATTTEIASTIGLLRHGDA